MGSDIKVIGRGFVYEDLTVGMKFRTHRRTICEADVSNFTNLTWLTEELFTVEGDEGRAIKGRAVPGALIYSFAEGLLLLLSVFDEESSLGIVQLYLEELRAALAAAAPPIGDAPPALAEDFERDLNQNLAALFGRG